MTPSPASKTYLQPRQYIADQWRDGRGSTFLEVLNPATEGCLARYPAASAQDIDEAIAAAARGFATWSGMTALARAKVLHAAAAHLRTRSEHAARLLTQEQGKPLAEAQREINQAVEVLEWFAEEGRRAYGRIIPSRWPGIQQTVVQKPIGPVAAFTPWNFPVMLSANKLAAALAAGCSVILKPAEETPAAVMVLVESLIAGGIPAGVVQLLLGDPAQISSALIAAPVIRKIAFTGSTPVGRQLGELSGRHLKRITLELGGHAPVIVSEDADLDKAVDILAGFKFRNAGQICAIPSRFYVQQAIYDTFCEKMAQQARSIRLDDGLAAKVDMGPMASRRRVEAMNALVEDAQANGAHVLCGGRRAARPGFFFEPTVLKDVPEKARIMNEETFGPIVPIASFDTLDEVIARANRLDVGLTAYGFTQSAATADRLSNELEAGAIGINNVLVLQPETPFGGIKDSGYGKENGLEGLQDYFSPKFVSRAL